MFKALHCLTGEEIVILEPQWRKNLDPLRQMARADLLVCQGCRQPVRVRAPRYRRTHFAHKHLGNCTFGQQSPELLQARAILYEWLLTQFGGGEIGETVSLEKIPWKDSPPEASLPRPVDGWVNTGASLFAYWIIETRLQPADRQRLLAWAESCGAQVHWIFLSGMLREDEDMPGMVILTTTERAFLTSSGYDDQDQGIIRAAARLDAYLAPVRELRGNRQGSLHYLDPENNSLTTFRGLHLAHSPQVFAGRKVQSEVGRVVASPQTGEFVHPGEAERLHRSRQEQAEAEYQATERLRKLAELQARVVGRAGRASSSTGDPVSLPPTQVSPAPGPVNTAETFPDLSTSPGVPSEPFTRPAKCISCGETTTDWVTYFGATRTCICRKCSPR